MLCLTPILLISAILWGGGDWVQFSDQTAVRLIADPLVGLADNQEKDYAWGDVDQDGDVDLVCVRKQPWNTPGRFRNVLFMNEGLRDGHAVDGVLVDRTTELGSAASDGGSGLLDATADRDVALVDLTGDGWLDIVTSTTYGEGQPKTISHPRVYVNQAAVGGVWQGFRYEEALTPTLPMVPHFCGMGVGDVSGDAIPDLYFVDYNGDLEDRLWINDGAGQFLDESESRLTFEMRESDFGVHAVIADLNGDGVNDVVKDRGSTLSTPPLRVSATYNDPDNEGAFVAFDVVYNGNPYFTEVGDLNNDGLLDLVVEDDGTDRYFINQGNGGDGFADFLSFTFSQQSDSFGGNIVIRDLDDDGFNDVLIADVDVDCCGCNRHMRFWRNRGDVPNVTFEEHDLGIPIAARTGTHDVAVFDINGDGHLDLVIGTCTGMSVWIRDAPVIDLTFLYPQGVPAQAPPGESLAFAVTIDPAPVEGTATLHAVVGGAPEIELLLVDQGGGLFEATLPAAACLERIDYYITAQAPGGGVISDPAGGAAEPYRAIAATGQVVIEQAFFETGAGAWIAEDDPTLLAGTWEVAAPRGTHSGVDQAAPDVDGDDALDHRLAFVTMNGAGGPAGDSDVDGGPTRLISPPFDLLGSDARITYRRWYYSSDQGLSDRLIVEVSADGGGDWVVIETVGTTGGWEDAVVVVGDHVVPSADVRLRFSVQDELVGTPASVVEAGIDTFRVHRFSCAGCGVASDCANELFCDGTETCNGDACHPGAAPCAGLCDEAAQSCVACFADVHCSDALFCNGAETCVGGACAAGTPPCSGQACDELADVCVDCTTDADCADGAFCNGVERCIAGVCAVGFEPCSAGRCNEVVDSCGAVVLQPRMGQPLVELTPDQMQRFVVGQGDFSRTFTAAEGLGPVFNQSSCAACHNNPLGGSGTITVTRFGTLDPKTGSFDSLDAAGGSLLQAQAIDDACAEVVPISANVQTNRATGSILGFGLVEALADADIEAHAIMPPSATVSGRVHMVEPLESPGALRVGRFGWKAQVATVLSFSADAALNEMGITNDFITTENPPNGDAELLADCDDVADPEDTGTPGTRFVDTITDFQRYLAPPPQTPRSGMAGEALFDAIGCTDCHIPTFITSADKDLEPALQSRLIKPYSDFLLHDMGQLFDGIVQGAASAGEIRTPPLWGLRVRDPLLHDGSVAGGTFADRVTTAIMAHGQLGSAARLSVEAFAELDREQRRAVVAFLDSLGRAEFDHDGDGAVDVADFVALMVCRNTVVTPDDGCAVSDIDQDGDIDGDDFALFVVALDGPQADCTDNGVGDLTEIFFGDAADCNGNGIPDPCDIATPVAQWATSVVAVSSEFNASPGPYSSAQALGAPDTFSYGANPTAWSASTPNGTQEFISLGYDTAVFATGVIVRETEGNGFVVQIDVIDTTGTAHVVWAGVDPSLPGAPVDFLAQWSATPFPVDGVTIHTDPAWDPGWESIDAVQLLGLAGGASLDADDDGVPDECVGCAAVADCADLDADGIRDDPCAWWACVDAQCQATDIIFADMGGQFGECAPDGAADNNDRNHALNCFADLNADQSPGYQCESEPPDAMNVDTGGQFGSCTPDGVCDGNDAFAALNAFSGGTPCTCPSDDSPAPAGADPVVTVEQTRVALVPSVDVMQPGMRVDVEVLLAEPLDDLRGYQLHIGVSGGVAGALDLVDIALARSTSPGPRAAAERPARSTKRPTQPVADMWDWTAFNVARGQMVAGRDGPGVAAEPGYLATFTFRASASAAGTFVVELLHDDGDPLHRTFLFPTLPNGRIAILGSSRARIEVNP